MRVFVTGASGFLGKHLCSRLGAEHEVVGISSKDCDLTKREELSQFDGKRFDQIFHLAAWTQAGDFCLRHPGEQWLINQKINTHVLDWWVQKQPQAKMIAMGTSCSYDPEVRLVEEEYLSGTPIESLFTYAMTKRMLLVGLMAAQKQFGLEYLYLIPSTLYGGGISRRWKANAFHF
jgi:GDP-L-fucose synthase